MIAEAAYKSPCDTALFTAAQQGGQAELEKLVVQNLPLVKYIVRRFLRRGKEYDDLFQSGCMGLIKAIRNFDCGMNVRFSTYAVPMIMGEIRRFLRDDNTVHISRSLHDAATHIRRFTENWEQEKGRAPDMRDICEGIGLDADIALLAVSTLQPVRSLSEPVAAEGGLTLEDVLPGEGLQRVEDRLLLQALLKNLNPTEYDIIHSRFFERKTQKEVGERLGYTQVQISRMESRILRKLRSLTDENATKYAIRNQSR